jgi:hypothetical protein
MDTAKSGSTSEGAHGMRPAPLHVSPLAKSSVASMYDRLSLLGQRSRSGHLLEPKYEHLIRERETSAAQRATRNIGRRTVCRCPDRLPRAR